MKLEKNPQTAEIETYRKPEICGLLNHLTSESGILGQEDLWDSNTRKFSCQKHTVNLIELDSPSTYGRTKIYTHRLPGAHFHPLTGQQAAPSVLPGHNLVSVHVDRGASSSQVSMKVVS